MLRKQFFRSLIFSFLFCFLPWMMTTSNPSEPSGRTTLPNGLEIFVLENPGTSSVSVDLWVKVGSRYETARTNGISHFVEHLLFKGTAKRTAQEISREIAAVGGMMNAYTHWEYTQLHISILPQNLSLALEILADVGRNSQMTEEMIAKERKVILEEISLANIYPPSYVLDLVSRSLFPDNPLALPISGTRESVQTIQREDLLQFYHRYYVPNNMILTVVGNVIPARAHALIRDQFSSWPRRDEILPSLFPPFRQTEYQEIKKSKFLDQAIVILALQAMGIRDIDRPAFEIINAVLGGGGHSRLYQEIREKRGLAYLVGSLYHPLTDTGLWGIYAGTDPKNIKEVQAIIVQQIQKIQEESLSSRELEEIKNYIRGRTLIRNERNHVLAEFIGQSLIGGSPELPGEFLAKLQNVSVEDVRRVARTYLKEEQRNFLILKPYPGLMLFRGIF